MSDSIRVAAHELPTLLRKYRLTGGRVRRVRVLYPRPNAVAVEFHVLVREATKTLGTESKPVRLVLRLDRVEEFRMQMRPNLPKSRIAEARVAYLNGLFYVSLDSLGLEPTETAQVFDFRVSEQYAAGRELSVREATPPESSDPPA
ncbi:MAG TPA: hypothetical protein VLM40_02040 [Gemmata sp.]|nr:hypothetical protein [Gemmata sp.]